MSLIQFISSFIRKERLENCYSKKNLDIADFEDFERRIYKTYNPLHFQESVVNDLILNYINENSKENEDNDNVVILSGYLNYDMLPQEEVPFNLPIYEVKKLLNLGNYNQIYFFLKIMKLIVNCEIYFKAFCVFSIKC